MSTEPEGQASPPVRKVFISYRREDSAAYAGRLYDAMVARFGEGNVFMDLDLAPGVDFVERITEAVGACQVLIEVIGPNWATVKDAEGGVRIADPDDFVRLELEIALGRPDVTVIPVLVSGARMPGRRDLPPELGAITRRNALELSDQRWRYDVGRLGGALEQLLAERTADQETVARPSPSAPGTPAVEPASTGETPATDGEPPAAAGVASAPAPDAVSPTPPRRRSWRGWAIVGVLTLAVAAVALVVGVLGGGSSDEGIEFRRFTEASAFTVDVPKGWRLDEPELELGQLTRTSFESPSHQMRAEISREPDRPPATRAEKAQTERSQEASYSPITFSRQTVDDRDATLFGYEIDETELESRLSTAYTYFFNAGEWGWRTRAVGVGSETSSETVLEIATRMAATLEPR